jgi:hypothetical protein
MVSTKKKKKKIIIVEGLWQAEAGSQFFERKLIVSRSHNQAGRAPGRAPNIHCREEWLWLPQMRARGEL